MKNIKVLFSIMAVTVCFFSSNILKAQVNGVILPPDLVTGITDQGTTTCYPTVPTISSNQSQNKKMLAQAATDTNFKINKLPINNLTLMVQILTKYRKYRSALTAILFSVF